MENASKALLMAGGVLLVMLIIALVVFAWGRFSDYYNNQDELKDIEDVTKFNLQFTGYERDDVHGYELISLANKVADYNMRYSSAADAKNDEKYSPIKMTINLKGKANKFNFGKVEVENGIRKIDEKQNSYFYEYNNKLMEQSSSKNDIIKIINDATGVEKFYRDSSTATKLAKSINSLILSQEQIDYNQNNKNMTPENSKKGAVEDYKAITGDSTDITYIQMVNTLTATGSNILKYYEYYQFKRGKFNCTGITYDTVSNRVSTMQFEFTGEIE